MGAYLVLARKYRSATFEEVVGQEHVAETLRNAIRSGRVAHAYLFVGTRGVGKTTMARILAKALNCQSAEGPTPEPCCQCDACRAIARGDDVDVIEIDGASNRGIDEIRELRSNAIYRPARCRYKVYYIDEVHMLTREAFNALLKTLEEPPAHVKFIFSTTEVEKVPPTIVSRCQRFDFRNIPVRSIHEHLKGICRAENVQADDAALFRIARAAAGSMRDGLSLLDQLLSAGDGAVREDDVVRVLGVPGDERTAAIVSAIAGGEPARALVELDGLIAAGLTLESAVEAVGEMFRHMMLIRACGADSDMVELPESQRKTAADLAQRFTLPALVQAVSLCQTTARNLRGLSGGRGLVEAALVRLAAADKFVDAASLTERLERLAAGGPPGPRTGAPGAAAATGYRPVGPAPDEKKKPVGPPGDEEDLSPALEPEEAAAPEVPAALPEWNADGLGRGWAAVISAIARDRQGHLSGLLVPAKVLAVAGDTVRLGYDAVHEPLRRSAERLDGAISSALGRVFGRPVRCEYVATGQPGQAPARPSGATAPPPAVSTSERAEINSDPAVRTVLDLFGGTVADIRRAEPTKAPGPEEQE